MRIGVDMIAVQSKESRSRGIGRYARSLVETMLRVDPATEYVLYAHDRLPVDGIPAAPQATVERLPSRLTRAEGIDYVARENPDDLDGLLLLSPFEIGEGYEPPAKPLNGLPLAAVVYDLVPFLFQEKYLTWAPFASVLYARLERLRRYDTLLAISEATRADCLRIMGLGDERVVNIRGASDPAFFRPDRSPPSPAVVAELHRLGVDRPFVFCLAGTDFRKNLWGLLDAFRLLPPGLRDAHQLVIAFGLSAEEEAKIRRGAGDRGIAGSMVLTGAVNDETLRLLYQRCVAFAMPSFYEGFGLPLLEALHCGAAVIGGNNSSQPEVVGDAGLLANVHDAVDIAAALERVLSDDAFADNLRQRAPTQAARFTWEDTARRSLAALRRAINSTRPSRRLRVDRGHAIRPRIAVFSAWPPKNSGIADYAARLIRELGRWYAVDLYHDEGYEPDIGAGGLDFGVYDYRIFDRNAALFDYRGLLYQMGNSLYHGFVYSTLLRHPGVVTLHDFGLAGFHAWYGGYIGDEGHLRREIERCVPEQATRLLSEIGPWSREPGGMADAFAARGIFLNRGVFEAAQRVVVHSPWCQTQADRLVPDLAGRVECVAMGATARPVGAAERQAIRDRFGLPREALVFGSFGILHDFKMNLETVDAFARVAQARPEALLLFVGKDLTGGEVARGVEGIGLTARVRFLGRQSDSDFADLIAATDVGVALRRPPTIGETSAALLDLLRHGVPTVVNDVGTFGDFPDGVVRKVRFEAEGVDGLARAMHELANDRAAWGAAAIDHIRQRHSWADAAARYVEVIERCHAERRDRLGAQHRAPALETRGA